MKKYFSCLLVLLTLFVSCHESPKVTQEGRGDAGRRFTVLCRVGTTPVKDQGQSDLCWVYGMLATIESEHIMRGDSVNLSADYVTRQLLRWQTAQSYLSKGRKKINLRGMMPMLVRLIDDHGVEPYDTYCRLDSTINYRVLSRRLEQKARTASSLTGLYKATDDLMDEQIGLLPNIIAMGGAQYTALEFAHSVCSPGEYIALTSFTHHPFGQRFALEVPDNHAGDLFLNIPIDSLMLHIRSALVHGHPVCWEGDISEPGFDWPSGLATLPPAQHPCTQKERQRAFETLQTTDDHVMELVGMARDPEGTPFFIAKNSWGTDNAGRGYIYLSEDYVRLKTIAVMMTREAFMTEDSLVPIRPKTF